MKTNLRISIFLFSIFVQCSVVMGQGFFSPPNYPLGILGRGSSVSQELHFVQTFCGTQHYTVSIFMNLSPWLTIAGDDIEFTLSGYGDYKDITIQGTVPMDWPFGYNFLYVVVHSDANTDDNATVDYECSSVGINDYITIGNYSSAFAPGGPVVCHADFHNNPPYYDAMSSWNLKMELFPYNSPSVTYDSIDKTGAPTMFADWSFNAKPVPNSGPFLRNEYGQIKGKLTVSGIDESGYSHYDVKWFGIEKEPDQPTLYYGLMDGNSFDLSYASNGATNYSIYYALHQGPPYDGTGAVQGTSPIPAGNSTNFTISGLQSCIPYYIAVKGINAYGASVYSEERKIILFNSPNQQPVEYSFNEVIINNSMVYSSNHYFAKNLTIEPGITLNVNSCFLFFDENSKLIIKPGGKLVLNGATCTSPCGQRWQGVEVWGNSSQHQFTINGQCYQGTIELNNNAVIENANNAIAVWHPGDYSSTGGIVIANNSTFRNNRRAIEFISYHNTHPVSGKIVNNTSHFNQCSFETNDNYIISNPFYAFLSMWDVEGIRINGCSFKNLKTFNNNSNRGYGIYSMDAKYNIEPYCSSNAVPCPSGSVVRSEFQGLFAGVCALNTMSTMTTSVNNAVFTDNSYGIKLNAVCNARVIFSNFYIGPNTNCPNFTGIGVELNNCNGYSVEENSFTYSNTWPIGANFMGIRIIGPEYQSTSLYNEIYHNNFSGITAGNVSEGYNGIINYPFSGLCYICNQNEPNVDYDFYIKSGGIAMYQGTNAVPAGNVFAHTNINPFSDLNNQSDWSIVYRYYGGNAGSLGIPGEQPLFTNNVPSPTATLIQNNCTPNYGTGNQSMKLADDQITALEQQFANNSVVYDNILSLYETLKDGGSTELLDSDIASSTPSQTMELRNKLLGSSPHLSNEILLAAVDKYDVLPDPILFEILSANPDELRNEELLSYLANRTPPFPDYMIDLLREISSDSTYKTTLQIQLATVNANKTKAVFSLLRNMLIDTVSDATIVRNWLDNLQNIQADYQIIDSYLQEGNTASAMQMVNMLSQLYPMDTEAQAEYELYSNLKTIQSDLINAGKNFYELNNDQISDLQVIAENSKGLAGIQAQNILSFGYDYTFINCAEIIDDQIVNRPKRDRKELLKLVYEPQVNTTPNPASNWVSFTYTIPASLDNPSLVITDLQGFLIKTFPVTVSKGVLIWDTREVRQGIYCFSLTNGDYSASGKIVIVH